MYSLQSKCTCDLFGLGLYIKYIMYRKDCIYSISYRKYSIFSPQLSNLEFRHRKKVVQVARIWGRGEGVIWAMTKFSSQDNVPTSWEVKQELFMHKSKSAVVFRTFFFSRRFLKALSKILWPTLALWAEVLFDCCKKEWAGVVNASSIIRSTRARGAEGGA